MLKLIFEYLETASKTLIDLDKKIGFGGILKYTLLGLFVIGLFNFKSLVKTGIELVTDLQDEIHREKIEKRDELMEEMLPLLTEFRGFCEADRVLYFEYHNSKENLVGIPFKYLDLMLECYRYGAPHIPSGLFRDITSGNIVELYEDIKMGKVVCWNGNDDYEFQRKYPGVYSLFRDADDSLGQKMFLSIPGYRQPIGLIVIEWSNYDEKRDIEKYIESSKVFLPRITALINSKVLD